MTTEELDNMLRMGENSRVQFKEKLPHADSFVAELVAMSNALGGIIALGVQDKTGSPIGLSYQEVQLYSQKLADYATNLTSPTIFVQTEVVEAGNGASVLLVHVPEGIAKPYKDRNLVIWTKQGADKRKVSDNAEILRFFQASGQLFMDEMPVMGTSEVDMDTHLFHRFFLKEFDTTFEQSGMEWKQALRNLNILKQEQLTLGGLLFFGILPQRFRPAFCIKAVAFYGNDIAGTKYRSSADLTGTVPKMFEEGMSFLKSHLNFLQKDQNFNSIGILEVSKVALEELLQNALVHRDYTRNSPIRLLIFDDRIEIISPGKLPRAVKFELFDSFPSCFDQTIFGNI